MIKRQILIIMKIKEIKNNYYFETLSDEHDLSHFDCGDDELNKFLKDDALSQQNAKLNVTKLVMCDGKIIGYTSLLTDGLVLKNIRDQKVRLEIRRELKIDKKNKLLPAVKIGRLAIDKKYIRKGLGTDILLNIIHNIRKIAKDEIGLRFIVVEGYAKALTFYKNNNFVNLEKDDEVIKEKLDIIIEKNPTQSFYLYLDLKRLE